MRAAPAAARAEPSPILLTGATGYIGGRLLRRLQEERQPVRCLTRRPEVLAPATSRTTEVLSGDVLSPAVLTTALARVRLAYYLIHSMAAATDFAELDRRAAANFAAAAHNTGVQQIVYLGGLASGDALSSHLASRQEVGQILRSSGVPTLELRCSIVIGSGSASYETVRAVVELLPLIIAPSSIRTLTQPIAVEDVLDYLLAASQLENPIDGVVEIGGADQLTYAEVMREYARQRGLRRRVIATPFATARLSRWFLSLATPVYGQIAATMIDSMRNETIVRSTSAADLFDTQPRGLPAAIERALRNEDREYAETRWSDALPTVAEHWGGTRFGRRRVFTRSIAVAVPLDQAFAPIKRIGGQTGWYSGNWFWLLRGLLDTMRGGVGLRRGRRDPNDLRVGDTIDFWRVERLEPNRRLLLRAEMKIPGRLWLQFELENQQGRTYVRQTTIFDPAGYLGNAYWYALYLVHRRVFTGMVTGIERAIQAHAPALSAVRS